MEDYSPYLSQENSLTLNTAQSYLRDIIIIIIIIIITIIIITITSRYVKELSEMNSDASGFANRS
jgi:hypothetical protein